MVKTLELALSKVAALTEAAQEQLGRELLERIEALKTLRGEIELGVPRAGCGIGRRARRRSASPATPRRACRRKVGVWFGHRAQSAIWAMSGVITRASRPSTWPTSFYMRLTTRQSAFLKTHCDGERETSWCRDCDPPWFTLTSFSIGLRTELFRSSAYCTAAEISRRFSPNPNDEPQGDPVLLRQNYCLQRVPPFCIGPPACPTAASPD